MTTHTTDRPALSALVRARTAHLHKAAETHPFQKALVGGRLPRSAYLAYLSQMQAVHEAVERAAQRHARHPAVAAVVRPEQFQRRRIEADLGSAGTTASTPLPSTLALARAIDEADPITLLGMHYVLEGSNNGARFIARAVARSPELNGISTTFLDPYGSEQGPRWEAFKACLDGLDLTDQQRDAFLAGASALYAGLMAVMDALHAAHPAPAAR